MKFLAYYEVSCQVSSAAAWTLEGRWHTCIKIRQIQVEWAACVTLDNGYLGSTKLQKLYYIFGICITKGEKCYKGKKPNENHLICVLLKFFLRPAVSLGEMYCTQQYLKNH